MQLCKKKHSRPENVLNASWDGVDVMLYLMMLYNFDFFYWKLFTAWHVPRYKDIDWLFVFSFGWGQVGLLFFFSTFWGFYPLMTAIFTFPQERNMLLKERASGMYRLSAYFWARIVGDLPLELTLPTAFVVIVYWMGGLKNSFVGFLLTLLVVLYNVLVAQVRIVILHDLIHWNLCFNICYPLFCW